MPAVEQENAPYKVYVIYNLRSGAKPIKAKYVTIVPADEEKTHEKLRLNLFNVLITKTTGNSQKARVDIVNYIKEHNLNPREWSCGGERNAQWEQFMKVFELEWYVERVGTVYQNKSDANVAADVYLNDAKKLGWFVLNTKSFVKKQK